MTKSYVSLEKHICPVCGITHATNSILIDQRLRKTLDMSTITGYSMCLEHKSLNEQGYLHLVAATNPNESDVLTIQTAHRTGEILSIKRTVVSELFNQSISENTPMVFIEPEVVEMIKDMMQSKEYSR